MSGESNTIFFNIVAEDGENSQNWEKDYTGEDTLRLNWKSIPYDMLRSRILDKVQDCGDQTESLVFSINILNYVHESACASESICLIINTISSVVPNGSLTVNIIYSWFSFDEVWELLAKLPNSVVDVSIYNLSEDTQPPASVWNALPRLRSILIYHVYGCPKLEHLHLRP